MCVDAYLKLGMYVCTYSHRQESSTVIHGAGQGSSHGKSEKVFGLESVCLWIRIESSRCTIPSVSVMSWHLSMPFPKGP